MGKLSRSRREAANPAPGSAAGDKRGATAGPPRVGLVVVAVSVLAGAGGLAWFVGPWRPPPAAPPAAAGRAKMGPADACRKGPRFLPALGMGSQVALATTLNRVRGLAIVDNAADPERGRVYRHETWGDAGYLGSFVADEHGNVYTVPAPRVSVADNPPALQNRVYRVDTDTRVMALFVELPAAQTPGINNPFGAMGLAYDCDTHSLYVSSVAGSTAKAEVGRIFQVDVRSGSVLAQWEGVDAFGVGVFTGTNGKRLYYGLARAPELYSIPLDAAGGFTGQPRFELSTAGFTRGGRNKIRRIRFGSESEMTLFVRDFAYTLQVASAREEDELRCTYDPTKDAWAPDAGGARPASQAAPPRRSR